MPQQVFKSCTSLKHAVAFHSEEAVIVRKCVFFRLYFGFSWIDLLSIHIVVGGGFFFHHLIIVFIYISLRVEIDSEVVFLLRHECFDLRWLSFEATWLDTLLLCTWNFRHFFIRVWSLCPQTQWHVAVFLGIHSRSDHLMFTTTLRLQACWCWPSWHLLVIACTCTLSWANSTAWLQSSGRASISSRSYLTSRRVSVRSHVSRATANCLSNSRLWTCLLHPCIFASLSRGYSETFGWWLQEIAATLHRLNLEMILFVLYCSLSSSVELPVELFCTVMVDDLPNQERFPSIWSTVRVSICYAPFQKLLNDRAKLLNLFGRVERNDGEKEDSSIAGNLLAFALHALVSEILHNFWWTDVVQYSNCGVKTNFSEYRLASVHHLH